MKRLMGLMSIALSVLTLNHGSAFAAPITTPVNAIRVTGLQADEGKFLHVLYVSASPGAAGTEGEVLTVRLVFKSAAHLLIPASGIVEVPAVTLPRTKVTINGAITYPPLNYLLFAVTRGNMPELYLKNLNETAIADTRVGDGELEKKDEAEFAFERLSYIDLLKFKRLEKAPGTQLTVLDASRGSKVLH
jgi:hypothetical protein